MRAAPSGPRGRAIGLVVLLSSSISARAQSGEPASGFIHVLGATAGVSIEVDGQARVSPTPPAWERPRARVLRDVEPGVHRVRAALPGHVDQLRVVTVGGGEATALRLRPWVPVMEPEPGVENAETGTLWVEALDVEATLDSAPLRWRKIALGGEPFVAQGVPAGLHKLTFCNPDKCLDFRVTIPAKETLALLVDFAPSMVHDVSSSKQAAWTRARTECEATSSADACERACNHELALTLSARSASCELLERGRPPVLALTPPPKPALPPRPLLARPPASDSTQPAPRPPRAPRSPTAPPGPGRPPPGPERPPPGPERSPPGSERPTVVSADRLTLPCLPLEGDRRGYVSLRTRSEAEVFLGATRIGATPVDRLEVPAGCVEFRVVVGRRVEKRLTVEVEPGKLSIYEVDL